MIEKKTVHRKVHSDGKRATLPEDLQDAEIVTYEYDEESGWSVKRSV